MTQTTQSRPAAFEIIHNDLPYTIRPATPADIPFLAGMQYEASLPPSNFSFWDYPLMGLGVESLHFIETVMTLNAGVWGGVEDFLILEDQNHPIAAAAGIAADADFVRGTVRINQIDAIGAALGWSAETTATFRARYEPNWPDPQGNALLLPQASWIIESVAVIPSERGKGLVKPLMTALLEEGVRRGHHDVGITVANGNDRAQKAYESLGFQMYLAFGPAFFGEPGFGGYTKYKRALS